jgi:hypothetical protein
MRFEPALNLKKFSYRVSDASKVHTQSRPTLINANLLRV